MLHPTTNIVQKSHILFTLSPFTHNTLSQTLTLIEKLVLPLDTHNSLVLPILVPHGGGRECRGHFKQFHGSRQGGALPKKSFAVVINSEPYTNPHPRASHPHFTLTPPGETGGTRGTGRGGAGGGTHRTGDGLDLDRSDLDQSGDRCDR